MSKTTLEKAYNGFIKRYDKASTRRAYEVALKPMVHNVGAGRDVKKITPLDMLEYIGDTIIANNSLSKHTRYSRLKSIKTFWNWLVNDGYIRQSPVKNIPNPRPRLDPNRKKAMTDDEYALLLDFFKYHTHHYALFLFLGDTGCRAGGAASLTINQLDIKKRCAEIIEKGDKSRVVYFGDECTYALTRWLTERGDRNHSSVFCWRNGKYEQPGISQIIRRACYKLQKAGQNIRSLGPHSLRHRRACILADAGIPVTVIARALGDSVEVIQKHYMPESDDLVAAAVWRTATPIQQPMPIKVRE